MLRMMMRTTMTCWDTPGELKEERLSQRWKEFERSWRKYIWLMMNIWTIHRKNLRTRAESWEWIILRRLATENQSEKTLELLRMGEKNFSQSKTIMRGCHPARTMNLQENGPRFRRNPSSVFKNREWRRETPPWIVEILRNEEQKGWTSDEKNMKANLENTFDYWEIILMSNFRKEFEKLQKNKESQVRSWEKTCGLGPTQKIHRWKGLLNR